MQLDAPTTAANARVPSVAHASHPAGIGRGTGHGCLSVRLENGRSVVARVRASSPLRFVRPTFPGSQAAAVCLVTFGGGLVDGDRIDLDIEVAAGATLVVFTQATTKAFRGTSSQSIRADVHGTLVLLPDPVACFRGATHTQRVDITLHDEGSAVTLDGFTSGRAAYGERWDFDALDLATTVRRSGRVLVRDAVRLARDDAPIASRMDRFEALATVLAVGPRVAPLTDGILAPSVVSDAVVAAPSALPCSAGAIVRIAATSPTHALDEARARLRNLPDIDVVDPFASRH